MEASILLWIQENLRCFFLTPIMVGVSTLGNYGIFWILILLGLVAGAYYMKTHDKDAEQTRVITRMAIVTLISLCICFCVSNLFLKTVVGRIRPYEVIEELITLVRRPIDSSFPSGHSSNSFAVATAFFLTVPKKQRWLGILLLVLAALTALSRLYVGVHYPTDVLAGTGIGILSGFAGVTLYDKKQLRSHNI